MDVSPGDHGEAVRFLMLRADLRQDLGEADADRHGDPQLCLDRLSHLLGDRLVGPVKAPPEAGEIDKGLVDGVFLDIGREPPHDLEHPYGKEAVGLVVGRQDHRVGTELLHLGEAYAALHAARLCFVARGRHDPALLAGDHRPALELRVDRLLAGCKERIGIEMEDGLRPGGNGEGLIVHSRHCR